MDQATANQVTVNQVTVNQVTVNQAACHGKVWLIGAGPGDPELLTLKAVRALQRANVVLIDDLVDRALLCHVPASARVIEVGKRGGRHSTAQPFIERIMIRLARLGADVARLKGGDPMIFGRGGEEQAALVEAGVECEVIPGITAALGTGAALGLPLTRRGVARGVTFLAACTRDGTQPDWHSHARSGATLVLYMGMATLARTVDAMLAAGFQPATPACAVENATLARQREIFAPLAALPGEVSDAGLGSPGLVVVGDVVRLARCHLLRPARQAA